MKSYKDNQNAKEAHYRRRVEREKTSYFTKILLKIKRI